MNEKERDYLNKFKSESISDENLNDAKKKSGKLKESANIFLLMISLVKDVIQGNYEIKKGDLAILIGIIIYVVSPIDAIPDIIPFFGFFDDISVVAWGASKFKNILEEYKGWKNK